MDNTNDFIEIRLELPKSFASSIDLVDGKDVYPIINGENQLLLLTIEQWNAYLESTTPYSKEKHYIR